MFSDPATNLAKLELQDGMKVVDVGAGSGFYTIEAAKRVGSSGHVYAIEVQKEILDRIKANGVAQGLHNIDVVWANAEKIGGTKLRENIADRIIISNVLFQIEKPEDFSLEMKRILKPGGKIMVIDWSPGSTLGPRQVFSAEKARILFERVGFKLEQSFAAGDHHYGLLLLK